MRKPPSPQGEGYLEAEAAIHRPTELIMVPDEKEKTYNILLFI